VNVTVGVDAAANVTVTFDPFDGWRVFTFVVNVVAVVIFTEVDDVTNWTSISY
jgi:hypothetical protein